jgi:3-oxoacyl-[acyl-carrier-protein] synthase III
MIVSLRRLGSPLATFRGAAFTSHAASNGQVLVKYGGTRFPSAPPGESPFTRVVSAKSKEIWMVYEASYGAAFAAFRQRFDLAPTRVVCNQVSPNIVSMIGRTANLSDDHVCRTGHEYGHVGAADVVIGLRRLVDQGQLDGPIAMAASAPYAFGAALVTPPGKP